jgi:hypothetical protein
MNSGISGQISAGDFSTTSASTTSCEKHCVKKCDGRKVHLREAISRVETQTGPERLGLDAISDP